MRIAIIGAGASGIVAAIHAAWNGAEVTVFERNTQVGKKLLVTGSGRCNITNDGVAAEKYSCADSAWMSHLLSQFGVSDLIKFLNKIGILVYKTSDGWYYPLSNSAQTVVNALENAMQQAGITLRLSCPVIAIQPGQKGLKITFKTDQGDHTDIYDRVIIAAGGKAYPTLGSRGELFPILEKLGHTSIPKRPALAPILAELKDLKALQGIRLDVGVGLWQGSKRVAESAGNLIFTAWGLNGPAVMDVSHQVISPVPDNMTLSLNFLKFFEVEFQNLLNQKRETKTPVNILLGAFFPPKAADLFPQFVSIPKRSLLNQISEKNLDNLVRRLRDTRLKVLGVRDFEYCQVSAGGVPVSEVDPRTMESRIIPGLFLTGETVDVVGPCGGYNLQYAFSSGALAGIAAATHRKESQS